MSRELNSRAEYRALINKEEEGEEKTPLCTPTRFTIVTLSLLVALLMGALFSVALSLARPNAKINCSDRLLTRGNVLMPMGNNMKISSVTIDSVTINNVTVNSVSGLVGVRAADSVTLGLITDIHIALPVLMAKCPVDHNSRHSRYGRFGCDSTPALTDVAMESLASDLGTTSSAVLFLGDGVAHQTTRPWDHHLALTSLGEVFNLFDTHFPHVSVLGTIGNNDLKDMFQLPDEAWYKSLIEWYRAAALRGQGAALAPDFEQTFLSGGYYSVKLPGNLTVISLHTNYFYARIDKSLQRAKATEQLAWLKATLRSLKKEEKAVIIGHHPPGVSLYSLVYQDKVKVNWWVEFFEEYRAVCSEHIHKITGMFFGHCHEDSFSIETSVSGEKISTFSIPSVSPVYAGQPSYVIAQLDRELNLVDMLTAHTWLDYYTRLEQKPKFFLTTSTGGALGVHNLTTHQLTAAAHHILREEEDMQALRTHTILKSKFYQERTVPNITPHLHYCFATNLGKAPFITCLERYGYDAKTYVVNS